MSQNKQIIDSKFRVEREYAKSFPGFTSMNMGNYALEMQNKFLSEGSRLLLVNGSFDPWSAIAYSEYQEEERDISSIIVPGGRHGAGFYPLKTDPFAPEFPAQQLYLKKFREWFHLK